MAASTQISRSAQYTAVGGSGLGVALGIILVWILEAFVLEQPIPGEVATAIGAILTGVLGYVTGHLIDDRGRPGQGKF